MSTAQSFVYSTEITELPEGREALQIATLMDLMEEAYRTLLIQEAGLVCLAHGSNDVANSIVPLLTELQITGKNPEWAYWLGGIGISLGLLTLGHKVMETVGKNVI